MELDDFLAEWNNQDDLVLVHTSGSTGKPKPMWVEKQRMLNSARITCDFLDLQEGNNALLCMPLDYIAGKMVVVRSILRGMNLISVEPCNHPLKAFLKEDAKAVAKNGDRESVTDKNRILCEVEQKDGYLFHFAAMVPSQVYCSLQVPEERAILRRIRHLIIGGGAITPELAHDIQSLYSTEECTEHFVWSTYGMTETLSHIALRRLNGREASEWYTPFESVDVALNDENCLVIDAPLVHEGLLVTNDIAELRDCRGTKEFKIIGRKDNVICSGGIKLQIEEIEDTLRPYIQSTEEDAPSFCITKRADEKFGEIAVLLIGESIPEHTDFAAAFSHLAPYSVPKAVIKVKQIPLTKTGKIDRKQCSLFAEEK